MVASITKDRPRVGPYIVPILYTLFIYPSILPSLALCLSVSPRPPPFRRANASRPENEDSASPSQGDQGCPLPSEPQLLEKYLTIPTLEEARCLSAESCALKGEDPLLPRSMQIKWRTTQRGAPLSPGQIPAPRIVGRGRRIASRTAGIVGVEIGDRSDSLNRVIGLALLGSQKPHARLSGDSPNQSLTVPQRGFLTHPPHPSLLPTPSRLASLAGRNVWQYVMPPIGSSRSKGEGRTSRCTQLDDGVPILALPWLVDGQLPPVHRLRLV
ncbi:hypothetical protein VTK73DRAFT_3719 [Phialemonium thermophilum]|uniref:Uncharacterized protein n=1 Tax=Phialemonium thermophilum TaxID=223376 RepID=A0ABR3VFW2_9PEZI